MYEQHPMENDDQSMNDMSRTKGSEVNVKNNRNNNEICKRNEN